ncbi:MAG: hypothetical protein WC421_04125 [Elusimicrobiales bacterium]
MDQIRGMRCDAMVEYAYTANNLPIVHFDDNTIITNPELFIDYASRIPSYLLPSHQQARLIPALEDYPVITVKDSDGRIILDGDTVTTQGISVNVEDDTSGPGRLELWRDGVNTGQLVASNNGFDKGDYYEGTDRTFTNVDNGLRVFGDMADGQYAIRAIDQAANYSTTTFSVAIPLYISTMTASQSGNTVYSVHWDTAAAAYVTDVDGKFNARADIDFRLDFSKPVSTYTFTAALMDGATTAFAVSKVGPPPSDSPKTWRGTIPAGTLAAAPGPKPSYALVISTGAEPGQTMFSEPVKFAVRPAIADSVYMLDGSSLCWHAPMSIASATVVAGAVDPTGVSSMTIIITLASDATSTAELLEPSVTVPAGTHYELYSNLPVSYEVRMYNMKPGEYGISAVSSDTETVSMSFALDSMTISLDTATLSSQINLGPGDIVKFTDWYDPQEDLPALNPTASVHFETQINSALPLNRAVLRDDAGNTLDTQELYGVLSATVPWDVGGLSYSTVAAGGYNTHKYIVEAVDVHGASRQMRYAFTASDHTHWTYLTQAGSIASGEIDLPSAYLDYHGNWVAFISKGTRVAAGAITSSTKILDWIPGGPAPVISASLGSSITTVNGTNVGSISYEIVDGRIFLTWDPTPCFYPANVYIRGPHTFCSISLDSTANTDLICDGYGCQCGNGTEIIPYGAELCQTPAESTPTNPIAPARQYLEITESTGAIPVTVTGNLLLGYQCVGFPDRPASDCNAAYEVHVNMSGFYYSRLLGLEVKEGAGDLPSRSVGAGVYVADFSASTQPAVSCRQSSPGGEPAEFNYAYSAGYGCSFDFGEGQPSGVRLAFLNTGGDPVSSIHVFRQTGGGLVDITGTPDGYGNINTALFTPGGNETFIIARQQGSTARTDESSPPGAATLQSGAAGMVIVRPYSVWEIQEVFLRGQGLIAPTGQDVYVFVQDHAEEGGTLKIYYTAEQLAAAGVQANTLAIWQLDAQGLPQTRLDSQVLPSAVQGVLPDIGGVYALLGSTAAVALPVASSSLEFGSTYYVAADSTVYINNAVSVVVYPDSSGTGYVVLDSTNSKVLTQGLTPETTLFFSMGAVSAADLEEGYHTISYGSVNTYQQYEPLKTLMAYADTLAPYTVASASDTAIEPGPGIHTFERGVRITLWPADSPSGGFFSGIKRTAYLVDVATSACPGWLDGAVSTAAPAGSCANPIYPGEFALSAGTHTVYYAAIDNVGNTEAVNTLHIDIKKTLFCGLYDSGSNVYGQPLYAYLYAENASKSYYAVDPSTALIAAGLTADTTAQFVAFDSAAIAAGLTEGQHTVAYGSAGYYGDYEILQSTPVFADATSPAAAVLAGGVTVSSAAPVAVTTGTVITISAQDPQSHGGASGVRATLYLVDDTASGCYGNGTLYQNPSAPAGTCGNPWYGGGFTLPAGTHVVEVDVSDNVYNWNWGKMRWTFTVTQ